MARVRVRRVGLVAAQGAAIGVATLFLVLAIAGFIPGLTAHLELMRWHGGEPAPRLLGMFDVSILHNLLHLAFGVTGLVMARTFARARAYLIGGGLIYLGLWLYGLLDAALRSAVPLNGADNWLHFGMGLTMVILGLTLAGARVPTGAEGEVLIPE